MRCIEIDSKSFSENSNALLNRYMRCIEITEQICYNHSYINIEPIHEMY